MDLTVDTSVIMAVVLNEPSKAALVATTKGAELLAAPSLDWEVGNALSALFKTQRINLTQARIALESYDRIPLRLADVDLEASVALADKYGVYAYDAYVLECAQRYQTPLLSLDGPQCEVARREGIDIVEVRR
jgi:predicted nucleic acid-binding protein